MELLSRLLGGQDRVKIMRLFLHHKESFFSTSEIIERTKSKGSSARREINALLAILFLERKKMRTVVKIKKKKKILSKIKEIFGFKLNKNFPHNQALEDLLFDFEMIDKRDLANRFKSVGRIKFFLVAGVFLGGEKSRTDILLVGESIKKQKAEKIFEALSAELGREVLYSIMDVEEYEYRFKMYDKFVRDILDAPHEVVVDKITVKNKG